MTVPPALIGRWNIASMDQWDIDAINLVEQGHVTFGASGAEMVFICVNLWLDCRPKGRAGRAVDFTFQGHDEGDEVSGHGHARLDGQDRIVGMIQFHAGDKSGFVARREPGL